MPMDTSNENSLATSRFLQAAESLSALFSPDHPICIHRICEYSKLGPRDSCSWLIYVHVCRDWYDGQQRGNELPIERIRA